MLRTGCLALACAAACGGGPTVDHTIDIAHDACAPLELVSASPTAAQLAGLATAQQLWRSRGAPWLGERTGAAVEVRFESAAGNFHGLYDDERGIIYINRAITSEAALSIVIAHELGHAFGLLHIPAGERGSVMNPGNLTIAPNDADRDALVALWGACAD